MHQQILDSKGTELQSSSDAVCGPRKQDCRLSAAVLKVLEGCLFFFPGSVSHVHTHANTHTFSVSSGADATLVSELHQADK